MGGGPYVYTQDFDSLDTGNVSWVDNSTISGWYLATGNGGSGSYTALADAGTNGAENFFNYGSAASVGGEADRALGSIAGDNLDSRLYGVQFVNNTGTAISSFTLTYTLEQWRVTTNQNPSGLQVQYKIVNGSGNEINNNVGYVGVGTLAAPKFNFASNTPLDGNLAENRVTGTFTVENLNLQDGQHLWVRWRDTNDLNLPTLTDFDHANAIDGVNISFQPVPAPPAVVALMIGSLVGSVQFGRNKLRRRSPRTEDESPSA